MIKPQAVTSSRTSYAGGGKSTIVVGKFQNRSTYKRGLFSEGPDKPGNQAKTTLETHLHQSGRFTVVARENMSIMKESISPQFNE
ncbi:MAG: hypothetical protein GXO96_03365 [Nitrospirae bacterium]|nr:hypothetical protein [Candidatus Manganitrophaceae bacterium]